MDFCGRGEEWAGDGLMHGDDASDCVTDDVFDLGIEMMWQEMSTQLNRENVFQWRVCTKKRKMA